MPRNREPQSVIRRDEIKRIPKEVSGLEYDVYAQRSPDGRGWDVIREVTEHPFREAQKAIIEASTVLASGAKIEWSPEQQAQIQRLQAELFRREQAGEIIDPKSPESMTHALQDYIRLNP